MPPLYSLLAPPLIGAFIGYMTNYVAIRMLFRPLRPWYLFGLRIPMTPGVIPMQRAKLADNIGEMVGEHLLTSSDVSRALTDDRFRSELRELIEGRVEEIMYRPLGPVASLVPQRFRSYFEAGVRVLRWRALRQLHSHLRSPEVTERLAASIAPHLDDFLGRRLGDLFPAESRDRAATAVEDTILRLLGNPAFTSWVRDQLDERIGRFIDEEQSLADLLPNDLSELLLDRLEEEAPRLIEKLAALLQEPVMQDRIARGITNAVNTFTSNLGPMAALVGSFVSPEAIDQKVREYLADKGEDISRWLFDETVQRKIAVILRDKASVLIHMPVAKLLDALEPETVAQMRAHVGDQVVAALQKPQTAAALTATLREVLAGQEERTVDEILVALFDSRGIAAGKQWTVDELVGMIQSSQVKRLLDRLLTDLVDRKLLEQPIGTLAELLPREVRHGIGDYLLEQISFILVREVPGLVDALNIRRIVARKVNSLDLLRLEDLLLSIMREQFKYINLFGALLGFLIGLANLAFLAVG